MSNASVPSVAAQTTITFSAFEGVAARKEIGERAYVLLDAYNDHVGVYTVIGSGVPERVFNGHGALVKVNPDADLEAVREVLEGMTASLAAYFDLYEGSRWDGHNHVAVWSDDDRRAELLEEIESAINSDCIPSYWDASDWLDASRGDLMVALIRELADAEGDLDVAVDKLVDTEVNYAREQGALIESDAAERAIRRYAAKSEDVQKCLAGHAIADLGLVWHVQPEDQGQTVEVAYAMHDGRCFSRATNKGAAIDAPNRVSYEYSDDVETFEPWNGVILDAEGGSVFFYPIADVASELLAEAEQ